MRMINFGSKSTVFLLVSVLMLTGSVSQSAKYSGEFLELGVSARALGMGGAYTAVSEDASSPYYNPAGLSAVQRKTAMFMHAETFGSLLNHDYIGGVMPVGKRQAGIGAALIRLGGGNIKITELSNDPDYAGINPYDGNIYRVARTANHADYTALFSYGTLWKSKTAVGVTAKMIYRSLADDNAFGLGLDFGMRSCFFDRVVIAAVLKDATSTFLSYSTGTTESIYPNLKIGIAYRYKMSDFDFLGAADASIKFEGRQESAQISVGGASSDFLLGGEIVYRSRVSGRLGLNRGDFTAGAGLRLGRFTIDAAFLKHDELDNSYRINLGGTF